MNEEFLQRMGFFSDAIKKTIRNVLLKPDESNFDYLVVFTGALTGYACHQIVKAKGQAFVVIGTDNNKKYYFGDSLNGYLLESQYSMLHVMIATFHNLCPDKEIPDIQSIISKVASSVGNENYKIANLYQPEDLYKAVKDCWVNIYNIATVNACKDPSEWSVLFAFTMHKIYYEAIQKTNQAEKLFKDGLESALYISKMDDDSI